MTPQLALLLLAIPVAAIGYHFALLSPRGALAHYWVRSCEGRSWRRAFPSSAKSDIRSFVQLFVRAFALPEARKLHFAPTDRIIDIYRCINPPGWPDSLELETFAKGLKVAYGVELRDFWSESLTLGEVFTRANRLVA